MTEVSINAMSSTASTSEPPMKKKRRNRTVLVCNVCKSRKVKCDRKVPCSSCITYKTQDICSYSQSIRGTWSDSQGEEQQNEPRQNYEEVTQFVQQQRQNIILNNLQSPQIIPPHVNNLLNTAPTAPLEQNPSPLSQIANSQLPPSSSLLSYPSSFGQENSSTFPTVLYPSNIAPKSSITSLNSIPSKKSTSPTSQLGTNVQRINTTPIVSGSIADIPSSDAYLVTTQLSDILTRFVNKGSVIGVNPIGSPDDTIFFFDYPSYVENSDKSQVNHGPFTWHALFKQDAALYDLWKFISIKSQEFKEASRKQRPQAAPSASPTPISRSASPPHIGMAELGGILAAAPFQVLSRMDLSTYKEFDSSKKKINKTAIPLGMNFTTNQEYFNDNSIDLSEKVVKLLPSKKIVWIHINRFFKVLYPFIPFIDEFTFKKAITKLIGEETSEENYITFVNISDNLDYAHMGMLLIILRMSFLSLISNNEELNNFVLKIGKLPDHMSKLFSAEEVKHLQLLLKSEIGIEFIDLARNCMTKFQLFQKTNLTILQFAMLMRVYFYLAPEDPEGPDRNQFQIYNGTLIQMAHAIGLNRDPEKIHGSTDVKANNIKRKMWHYLVYLDVFQGISYGGPLSTDLQYSDTKFPFAEEGNTNINFEYLDGFITKAYYRIKDLPTHWRNILNVVLNVNGPVKMIELTEKMNALELYVAENLGKSCSEFAEAVNQLNNNDLLDKVFYLHYYFQSHKFLINIYSHMFLHYEKQRNLDLAFFYLKKSLCILIKDFLPNSFRLMDHQHYFFCHFANLFVNPNIECFIHNTSGLLFSIIIRVEYTLRALKLKGADIDTPNARSYMESLEQLKFWLIKCAKVSTIAMSRLGKRYLYAWRISKSHIFILKSIQSDEYYQPLNDIQNQTPGYQTRLKTLTNFKLKIGQVNDLVELLKSSLVNLDKSELTKDFTELFGAASEDPVEEHTRVLGGSSSEDFALELDDLFAKVSMRMDPAVFDATHEIATDPMQFQAQAPIPTNIITSAIENYVSLDNPYFDVFNDLPLDQLLKSFDQ
ncbi:uncharacterized protein J8A68_005392 [[Candida] subhashii]|uniref:Zn(2)-C6 fungal-type domain-containing protein n=1 Tax=[Candida] subhashii TaxID=561895 RepID=A0A8J5Q6G5_9ASCO|nr:uncharacterized protein J8A68_005392 [[Candida] subhashii]KAG7661101.1 hypothetical protein J8A68_005392 [[Candida] subhashii]